MAWEKRQRQGALRQISGVPDAQPTRVDRDVQALRERAATNSGSLTHKQRQDRKRKGRQVKLDLACPERKAALEMIAEQNSTSMSQAANLLLAWAMWRYFQGDEEIKAAFYAGHEPSRTPRFEWNIREPEAWVRLLDDFESYGDVNGDV